MMPDPRISTNVWSRWTALVLTAGLAAACVDETVAPDSEGGPPSRPPHVLGFVELTFTGIGTPELSSNVLVAPTIEELEALRAERTRSGEIHDFIAPDLARPANSDDTGDGTIQLSFDERSEFVFDGIRYLRASYFVRNAQISGAAYDTERNNLTFLAVNTTLPSAT